VFQQVERNVAVHKALKRRALKLRQLTMGPDRHIRAKLILEGCLVLQGKHSFWLLHFLWMKLFLGLADREVVEPPASVLAFRK
jgi:hypothetical protein